jgi:hypothetical protein
MLTISIMGVVTTMAVFQIGQAQPSLKGDGAMRVVMAQISTAREQAITQRRNMQLTFNGSLVQVIREEVPGPATKVLAAVPLEGRETFSLYNGIPDTPDAFGNASAVAFGAAATMRFTPDGMLVDQTGNPLNGTVFLSIPNEPRSVRAVTIFGPTGRVRGYRWDGKQWKLV